jgi:hypothetical protein
VAPKAGVASQPATPPASAEALSGCSDLPQGVAVVIEAIQMFDQVLTEENAALVRFDTQAVAALQDRKLAVTRLYQERLRALMKDGGMTNSGPLGMTPEQRGKVIALVQAFERRMAHNTALLKAGMNSIERLFQAVNEAVLKKKVKEVAYTKVGQMANRLPTGASALAFNQSV